MLLATLVLLACSSEPPPPEPGPTAAIAITVLAASSLTDVLPQVAADWTASTANTATFTFDSTSRLAKQVEAGLVADVFFSSDTEWMGWLQERSLVQEGSPRNLLTNTLVLVVPSDASFVPASAADLADVRIEHLGMGGESVPAGKYGRAALGTLGQWDALSAKVVSGDTVRTVLDWTATGEVQAGIAYATDANVEPRVRVAFTFPADSHTPIVYAAAVTAASPHPEEASAFLAFCASEAGRVRFEAAGFGIAAP